MSSPVTQSTGQRTTGVAPGTGYGSPFPMALGSGACSRNGESNGLGWEWRGALGSAGDERRWRPVDGERQTEATEPHLKRFLVMAAVALREWGGGKRGLIG